MTLWRFEARKMFRVYRGALILALFLAAEVLAPVLGDAPVDAEAALCRGQYLRWLRQVEGPWTQEKADFLETEAARGADDPGFEVIFSQYRYVSEGKENRYFLDSNGWAGLLSERGPDLMLTAAVILLCVPVYCGEAGAMEALAVTSREGRRLFRTRKPALALAAAVGLTLAAEAVRLGFYGVKYGLPHGGYPGQSVELYGSAQRAMTLWGAEGLTAGLRVLGTLELASLTLCVSALSGQFALSAFLAAASAVLPWLGLGRQARFSLPLPSSLLTAAGFLRGSEFETDAVSGARTEVFREVSWGRLALISAGAAGVCVLCMALICLRYRTALPGGRKRRSAALGLVLCLILSGCGGGEERENIVYNSRDRGDYVYGGLTVSVRGGELLVTDSSGGVSPLIRDPLRPVSGAVYGDRFYGAGRYVYFWKTDSEGYSEMLDSDTGRTVVTSLIRADLTDFGLETVYERSDWHTVLGIDLAGSEMPFSPGGDFFADGRYAYLLTSGVRRLDLRTGRISALDIPSNGNVAYDGRYIYFISSAGILSRFDTADGGTVTLSPEPVSDFRLTAVGLEITPVPG